jgi:hypothetical protein
VFWAHAAFSALAAAALFALAARARLPREGQSRPGPAWFCAECAALVALLAAAAVNIARYLGAGGGAWRGSLPILIRGLFTLFAAACVAAFARRVLIGRVDPPCGIFLTVPVFWSVYMLIYDYWSRAGNPSAGEFIYLLFALIAATLMLYYAAALFYAVRGGRAALAACGAAVYFSLTALCGPLFARLLAGTAPLPRAGRLALPDAPLLLFALAHAFALSALIGSRVLCATARAGGAEDELAAGGEEPGEAGEHAPPERARPE